MNDLIETLKKNQIPFGLLLPEEKACFRKVGKKNCVIYTYAGWERTDGISYADISTYAIKKKYQPEPDDLEIVEALHTFGKKCLNVLGCICTEEDVFMPIHELPSLPNFEGFRLKNNKEVEVDFEWVARHHPDAIARFGR